MNIALLTILILAANPSDHQQQLLIVGDDEIELDAIGNCESGETQFDLRRLMILENRELDVVHEGMRRTIRLVRETVEISGNDDQKLIINIGHSIADDTDIDIELKLAVLDGDLMLYWRETYQHRIFRQGLFTILGEEVEPLCEGRGGVWSSH